MTLRNALSLFAAVAALSLPAFALAQVESTPIPTPPKPDLSPMAYRVGTWTCTNTSSRRPRPFMSTVTYTMDPSGYWLNATTTTPAISWFPHQRTGMDKITYDTQVKRWVDVGYDDLGGYGYTVSTTASTPTRIVWHDMSGTTGDPTVASSSDVVETKVSDTQVDSTSSFKEQSGRNVTFTTSCKKQS